ncbi:hypothetical protein RND81_11G147800 [Saponaria officinalis]|uniref:Uncharacterized protein n=1 Tax=Saponaria officinalis TaxID=3572 RepID=A0AAW1HMK1_SAPOF
MYARGRSNPSYRSGSSSRGRGRGNYITNNSNLVVQHGSKKLIAANISGTSNTELEEFYKWRDIRKREENSEESLYANVVKRNHSIEADMLPNDEERVILLLNESDEKLDDKPWFLFDRYLKPHDYTMEVYKTDLLVSVLMRIQHTLVLMNRIKHFIGNKTTIKNSITKEVEVPQNLDLLNKWTIPKVNTKTIYQLGTFERLGLKQVVKTTEESISLNNTEMVLQLLNNYDLKPYRKDDHKFIHIGLVQVAFKPLTMEGLPESFVAALRDARNLDWKKSIMGVIKTSLAHGPVYFDVYPNLTLSLSDDNILDALTLNVKTHGYNYAQGSEVICICYRIYFKSLFTLNPCCRLVDKQINETIIIETNFHKSDITTRRRIKWEEISFPDNWKIERAIQPKPMIYTDLLNITESDDGSVSLNFGNNQKLGSQRTNSMRSYISPYDYYTEPPSTSRCSTSQLPDNTFQIFEADENEKPVNEPNKESKIDEYKVDSNNLLRGHSNKNVETMSQMDYEFAHD